MRSTHVSTPVHLSSVSTVAQSADIVSRCSCSTSRNAEDGDEYSKRIIRNTNIFTSTGGCSIDGIVESSSTVNIRDALAVSYSP